MPCLFGLPPIKAARQRNPSLPVKLLGYKTLREASPHLQEPPVNSESLPDLKWTPNSTRRVAALRQARRNRPNPQGPSHSVSDPALVASAASSAKQNGNGKLIITGSPRRIEQLRAARQEELVASSTSDCSSEQSGWVSSNVSSRHSSPARSRIKVEDPAELEPIPLAPPEEFQVTAALADEFFNSADERVNDAPIPGAAGALSSKVARVNSLQT